MTCYDRTEHGDMTVTQGGVHSLKSGSHKKYTTLRDMLTPEAFSTVTRMLQSTIRHFVDVGYAARNL